MKKVDMSSDKFFGYFFFLFFIILSYFFKEHITLFFSFLFLGILFLFITLFKFPILGRLNIYWKKFGFFLGKFISPLVLFLIYFTVVVLTNLILKIFKKDILSLQLSQKKQTYWINKLDLKSSMDKQF